MNPESATRRDIQSLRGFAVLLVVLYHAEFPYPRSGYLGVDIFFVVSGYLITGLIARDVLRGTFSLPQFYFRRAKRLWPAAYTVLVIVALAAPFFLSAAQLAQFNIQVLGAATATANFVFWSQVGYFDTAAVTKPLLHFWSLAIEEQYYLLAPVALLLAPRRFWLPGAIVVFVTSLAYCLFNPDPAARFYLIPSRAWEIAIGSIAALLPATSGARLKPLWWPAIVLLLVLPGMTFATPATGWPALAACAATAVLLLANKGTGLPGLTQLGNISYSLYLVHWPIFAFMRAAYIVEAPPREAFYVAITLSLIFAVLLYRLIERPLHLLPAPLNLQTISLAVTASAAVIALPYIVNRPSTESAFRTNYGFAARCDFATRPGPFVAGPDCRSSDHPRVLVWGDSHAMHLIPGLAKTIAGGVMQATRSSCGPFVGIASYSPGSGYYTREHAADCLAFNEEVLRYTVNSKDIRIVVLSASLSFYLDGFVLTPDTATVTDSISRTAEALRNAGKRVVFISSPPFSGFDTGACLDRKVGAKITLGGFRDCSFPRERAELVGSKMIALLSRIKEAGSTPVIDLKDHLCSSGTCIAELDGVPLYLDSSPHFSYAGSEAVAAQLAQWIEREAR